MGVSRTKQREFEALVDFVENSITAAQAAHDGDHWCKDMGCHHIAKHGPCDERRLADFQLKLFVQHMAYYGLMPDDDLPVSVVTLLGELHGDSTPQKITVDVTEDRKLG